MSQDKFHIQYYRLLVQNAEEAPDDVWNNINQQLNDDASVKQLSDEEQALIDEVWNGIENELDIDEVWNNVVVQLDENKKSIFLPRIKYWLAAAIVMLLIGLTGVMQYFTHQVTQPLPVEAHLVEEQSTKNDSLISDKQANEESKNISITKQPNEVNGIKQHITKLLRSEPDAKASNLHYPNTESSFFARSPMLASGSYFLNDSIQLLQSKHEAIQNYSAIELNPKLVLPDNEPKHWMDDFQLHPPLDDKNVLGYDRKDSRWTTGVVTALKNTYLLNAETLEGFTPTAMNSSKVTFQPDIGLNVQYSINHRFIAESNVFLTLKQKQTYQTYNYGEYVSKENSLNYLGGEFALKHNAKYSMFGDKIIRRNVGGVYINHLQSATEVLSNQSQDVSARYATIDYGIILGQEFELRSKGPVKVSTGLVVKYGLPNIYLGDDSHPQQFNKTHNASIEFRLGIGYRWGAKKGIDHYLGLLNKRKRN